MEYKHHFTIFFFSLKNIFSLFLERVVHSFFYNISTTHFGLEWLVLKKSAFGQVAWCLVPILVLLNGEARVKWDLFSSLSAYFFLAVVPKTANFTFSQAIFRCGAYRKKLEWNGAYINEWFLCPKLVELGFYGKSKKVESFA